MGTGVWALVPEADLAPGFGALLLTGDGEALTGVWFSPHRAGADRRPLVARGGRRDDADPVLREAARQLRGYFARERTVFDLPLAPSGSPFQLAVWRQLRAIPYGTTTTYGEIARRLGLGPEASRAVGTANGANPLSIVVPCHRVIGANGSLTGFGGGLARKRTLLDLEQALPATLF